ncbi:MAG: B12-binding domain-containing radical SAM protein [Caldimicrobium sp.]|nr:B12-binding domain-containing radical SAM protein [Caldimicrobium sp.]MCX7872925.1 B12-binding domain-containing radical SAM protein [Caldimicrobium sp.]MDW8094474.1 B12-binding domain-containing radical SAM protein [Caldimicrobium sp.]
MKALLVYPAYPDTFWSFRYALKLVNKKASHPPLGLLTVASLLPTDWKLKLVDLNVEALRENDIKEVDLVLISAMSVQRESAEEVIRKAKSHGKKILAGGPLFTAFWQDFERLVDHLILGEAEVTLPTFLKDLKEGTPKRIYYPDRFADLTQSPIPAYNLISFSHYSSMSLQYSRGCPFNCEFCEVTNLFGHQVRTKRVEQVLEELENLYKLGWRGSLFIVDDNFIGGKRKVKEELLPAIIKWQQKNKYPFYFYTQVSINLADDEELIDLMVKAGFTAVFIGIETPSEDSLLEANKIQNKNRNLVEDIRKIQRSGLEVMGGFILGFDNDPSDIFNRLINFIKESRIVIAMVGLLNAPPGTKLYKKLLAEGRIKPHFKGDNTDMSTNIIPKIGYQNLLEGYKEVIRSLYHRRAYYERISAFLEDFTWKTPFTPDFQYIRVNYSYLLGILKILIKFGLLEGDRKNFWKLIFKTLWKKPQNISVVLAQIASGYHFRCIFKEAFS